MQDAENTVPVQEVAPQADDAQSTQGGAPVSAPETPTGAPSDTGETLLAGKYKSVQDLENSYKELERKFHETRRSQAESVEHVPPPGYLPANDVPELDPEADAAVTHKYRQLREEEKAAEFVRKHADDLKNPIVRSLTKEIIAEHRQRGEYIDQEAALAQAKQTVAEQLKPQMQEAEDQAFQNGQALARTKQLHGAVGETNRVNPKVDPDTMSAEDFARYYNLPRV